MKERLTTVFDHIPPKDSLLLAEYSPLGRPIERLGVVASAR